MFRPSIRTFRTCTAALRSKYDGAPKFPLPFPERRVTFEACEDVYAQWRREKTYRLIPPGPLSCRDVRYIDTAPGDHQAPTVVMMHGSPGTYGDFALQINYLHAQGARVVAPNFPDFAIFPSAVFKHTALEKYSYIREFLKAIDLQRIDMLVGHSSAIYPLLHLYLKNQSNFDIGSLALLNPGGHRRIRVMHPAWAYDLMFHMMTQYKYGYYVVRAAFGLIMTTLRPPLRRDSFDRVVQAGQAQALSGWQTVEKDYLQVKKSQIPTLIAFSDNDVLMHKEMIYDLLHKVLKIGPEEIWKYDKEGKLVQNGSETGWPKVLNFTDGSHYVFWKYPDLVNQALLDLLTRRQQSSQQPAKQRILQN